MQEINNSYLTACYLKHQNKMLAIAIAQIFNLPITPESLCLKVPEKIFCHPLCVSEKTDTVFITSIQNMLFPQSSIESKQLSKVENSSIMSPSCPSTIYTEASKDFRNPETGTAWKFPTDTTGQNFEDCSQHDGGSEEYNGSKSSGLSKRNGINYKVLEGHQYEVLPNPESNHGENTHIYIWKYDGCGKTFTKTYNLVYHFRVHTNEKPFKCKHCDKRFSQKGNLGRHLETHEAESLKERKVHQWPTWLKGYTSVYNLRVSYILLYALHYLKNSI